MEFIIELLFEIIVEGSIELSTSKKAPMPLRILAFMVCIAFVGIIVLAVYTEGYDALITDNTATAVTLYVVGSLIVMVFFYIIYKQFRDHNKKKELTATEQICEVKTSNLKLIRNVCIILCSLIILATGAFYLN